MKPILLVAASAIALAACNNQAADTTAANDTAPVNETADAGAMTTEAALGEIKHTSWEFTDDGKAMQESIDDSGNYITNSGSEHIDHGTATMKDGKACFTSAMTDEGEVCWTDPKLEVGQTGETTSDKGKTLTIKRVPYTPLTMPAN